MNQHLQLCGTQTTSNKNQHFTTDRVLLCGHKETVSRTARGDEEAIVSAHCAARDSRLAAATRDGRLAENVDALTLKMVGHLVSSHGGTRWDRCCEEQVTMDRNPQSSGCCV